MMNIAVVVTATMSFILIPAIASAANEPSIAIDTLGADVDVGDQFIVPITVSDVPAATGLGSWQFDVGFDPAILSATAVTEGPFLSSFGQTLFTPPIIDDAGGQVIGAADAYVDLPPEPYGSGVLAYVDFTALAAGASPLAFANVFLNGDDGGFSMPAAPVTLPVAAAGSPPAPVTEPPAGLLLAPGALLLAAASRLRKESLR